MSYRILLFILILAPSVWPSPRIGLLTGLTSDIATVQPDSVILPEFDTPIPIVYNTAPGAEEQFAVVWLHVRVTESGRVESTEIVYDTSTLDPGFAEAFASAMLQAQFPEINRFGQHAPYAGYVGGICIEEGYVARKPSELIVAPPEVIDRIEHETIEPLNPPELKYPEHLCTENLEVGVLLKVRIGRDGKLVRATPTASTCSDPSFMHAALDGILGCEFPSRRVGGRTREYGGYVWVQFDRDLAQETADKLNYICPTDTVWLGFEESIDVAPPEMTKVVTPDYPDAAYKLKETGVVWVEVLVNASGKVSQAMLWRTSGHYLLDEAALDAAYDNEFKPAIQGGKGTAVWVTYRVDFSPAVYMVEELLNRMR